MNGIQINPAFCSQTSLVAPPSSYAWGKPPLKASAPLKMTIGTTACITPTPRLPAPAFHPRAAPVFFSGKKKLMWAMLAEKLPPPRPQSSAMKTNTM